jgi:parallel beta-helix repeat protein
MEISGSRFDTLPGGQGINVRPDIWESSWKESGWVDGLVVDHCYIVDTSGNAIRTMEPDSSYSGHTDLTFSNNRIVDAGGYGISLANCDGVLLDDNTLVNTGGVQILSTAKNVTQS